MTYIGKQMFRSCQNLKHICIPSNIKEIMESAFLNAMRKISYLTEGLNGLDQRLLKLMKKLTPKLRFRRQWKVIEDYALQNVKNIALTDKIPLGFQVFEYL